MRVGKKCEHETLQKMRINRTLPKWKVQAVRTISKPRAGKRKTGCGKSHAGCLAQKERRAHLPIEQGVD